MALHAKRNCQGTRRNIIGRKTQDQSRRTILSSPTRKAKKMARYRLKVAHALDTTDGNNVWLAGDVEAPPTARPNEEPVYENGTIVGDGTRYVVKWPTLEMEPLDAEAEAMVEKERERLTMNDASASPIDDLLVDDHEERYIPGLNKPRRQARPDGAPARDPAPLPS
jgi:hypothetical protein